MSFITVENVKVLNNPSPFGSEFQFEITFDCLAPGVQHELEWKLIYVGSAENEKYDQELDAVMVGPVQVGKNKFLFTAPAPDSSKIPNEDLLEVTVLLLTCSYQEHEFIRIGYYVNNEMQLTAEQTAQIEALTKAATEGNTVVDEAEINKIRGPIEVKKITRNILDAKPRVTRFNIPWDKPEQFPELSAEERQRLEASTGVEEPDRVGVTTEGFGTAAEATGEETKEQFEEEEGADAAEGEEGDEDMDDDEEDDEAGDKPAVEDLGSEDSDAEDEEMEDDGEEGEEEEGTEEATNEADAAGKHEVEEEKTAEQQSTV